MVRDSLSVKSEMQREETRLYSHIQFRNQNGVKSLSTADQGKYNCMGIIFPDCSSALKPHQIFAGLVNIYTDYNETFDLATQRNVDRG